MIRREESSLVQTIGNLRGIVIVKNASFEERGGREKFIVASYYSLGLNL